MSTMTNDQKRHRDQNTELLDPSGPHKIRCCERTAPVPKESTAAVPEEDDSEPKDQEFDDLVSAPVPQPPTSECGYHKSIQDDLDGYILPIGYTYRLNWKPHPRHLPVYTRHPETGAMARNYEFPFVRNAQEGVANPQALHLLNFTSDEELPNLLTITSSGRIGSKKWRCE